ncbi:MAG: hypothetical protein RSE65_17715 [Hafnia sp.]
MARIVGEPQLDKAIHLARFLGELLWKNSTGCYQLAEVERSLLERLDPLVSLTGSPRVARYGHVLTKAYDVGGHTRVVERLSTSVALQDSAVLVLESAQDLALQRLSSAAHGCIPLFSASRGLERIAMLAEQFARFEVLVLYIHPHDIEAVLAAGIAQRQAGVRVMLFNHADHVFTYGLGVAERVLEISHFGWALREARESLERSVFVGIPLHLPAQRPAAAASSGPIVSAGTSYKFRPAQGWSFPNFVRTLSQRLNGGVEIIGPRCWLDWWWWSACCRMGKRLNLRRRLGHDDYLAFIARAAAYVDSFPFVGGTAFAEVMGRGVPCFGVLTGSHGYTPADLLKSMSVAELVEEVVKYTKSGERPALDENDIYEVMLAVHDVECVARRVADALADEAPGRAPPWPCKKEIDTDIFRKIWLSRILPAFPVHVWPLPKMILWFFIFSLEKVSSRARSSAVEMD